MRWICGEAEVIRKVAAPWARAQIGNIPPFQADCTGLALFDDLLLRAAVIYTDYTGRNICMHVASDGSRRWMTKTFLRAAFSYPFDELGCARVTGVVAAGNRVALQFDKHLGFRHEGRLRCAHHDGSDMIVLGMLRSECRFLQGQNHGHGQGQRAVCA